MRLLTLLLVLVLPLAGCDTGSDFTYRLFDPGVRAKEAALRANLRTLRDVIGQHRGDKGRPLETLQGLVTAGYLRTLPVDPFTESSGTWIAVHASPTPARGVVGVRSGAPGRGTDGRPYRDW